MNFADLCKISYQNQTKRNPSIWSDTNQLTTIPLGFFITWSFTHALVSVLLWTSEPNLDNHRKNWIQSLKQKVKILKNDLTRLVIYSKCFNITFIVPTLDSLVDTNAIFSVGDMNFADRCKILVKSFWWEWLTLGLKASPTVIKPIHLMNFFGFECPNAHAKVKKWIFNVEFPRNCFEFDIILNDFWSSPIWDTLIDWDLNSKNPGIQPNDMELILRKSDLCHDLYWYLWSTSHWLFHNYCS